MTLQGHSENIGDSKRIGEYLKLPIQRINDFQVLIQVKVNPIIFTFITKLIKLSYL